MKRHRPLAFTLIELLVVIAVISILAAMTAPTLISSMRTASRVKCASNLKQLGAACVAYATQWDQYYPNYGAYADPGTDTGAFAPPELITPYADDPGIHVCPVDPSPNNYNWWRLHHPHLTKCSYMWSEHLMTYSLYNGGWQRWSCPRTAIFEPTSLAIIADGGMCPNGWTWRTCLPSSMYTSSRIDWSHDGGVNVLFGDMRVERIMHRDIDTLRASPFRSY